MAGLVVGVPKEIKDKEGRVSLPSPTALPSWCITAARS